MPLGLLPTMLGVAGMVYFYGAMAAGAVFLALGFVLAISRSRRDARVLFYASLVYLPVVYGLMVVDKV